MCNFHLPKCCSHGLWSSQKYHLFQITYICFEQACIHLNSQGLGPIWKHNVQDPFIWVKVIFSHVHISPQHLLEISKRWGDIKIGYKTFIWSQIMSAWERGTLRMNVGFEMFDFKHSFKYENFVQWSFSSWWIKPVGIGRCIWTVELLFIQSRMTLLLLTVSKVV